MDGVAFDDAEPDVGLEDDYLPTRLAPSLLNRPSRNPAFRDGR